MSHEQEATVYGILASTVDTICSKYCKFLDAARKIADERGEDIDCPQCEMCPLMKWI